jgi:tagaturonate epimerase
LALAGGNGLKLAKEVYRSAYDRSDELCGPYASVIDIDPAVLPSPDEVDTYTGDTFASALRHDQACSEYNRSFRQLLHVGYKVAAEMGERYYAALEDYADVIAENVTENIFERHISRLFLFDE